jgi:hypothetical protein
MIFRFLSILKKKKKIPTSQMKIISDATTKGNESGIMKVPEEMKTSTQQTSILNHEDTVAKNHS